MHACAGAKEYKALPTSKQERIKKALDKLSASVAKTLSNLGAVNWADPGTVNSLTSWIRSERTTDADKWNPLLLADDKQKYMDKIVNALDRPLGAFIPPRYRRASIRKPCPSLGGDRSLRTRSLSLLRARTAL